MRCEIRYNLISEDRCEFSMTVLENETRFVCQRRVLAYSDDDSLHELSRLNNLHATTRLREDGNDYAGESGMEQDGPEVISTLVRDMYAKIAEYERTSPDKASFITEVDAAIMTDIHALNPLPPIELTTSPNHLFSPEVSESNGVQLISSPVIVAI